ncbi:Receptor expression-enhancing protein [Meloidogyne graminicola]|uniref:Receptor expression-enhancing protein n=1 Tax=Meloidogyne graminicola TaxID=189291 RepID=A0A8S9ZS50_9BILA|nr:Receptor expression-enhancing protein [Meloidogyne graminicola]
MAIHIFTIFIFDRRKDIKASWIFLYKGEYPLLQELLGELEKNTGIKRHQFAYGLFAIIPLYLLVGRHAGLVCNFITFVYPAFATLEAVRSTSQAKRDDDIQWLVYWTVFGILSIVDHVPFQLADGVQLYWLFKSVGLFYLSLPEVKVAAKLFLYRVEPLVVKVERFIERPKKEVVVDRPKKEVIDRPKKEVIERPKKEVVRDVVNKGGKSKHK